MFVPFSPLFLFFSFTYLSNVFRVVYTGWILALRMNSCPTSNTSIHQPINHSGDIQTSIDIRHTRAVLVRFYDMHLDRFHSSRYENKTAVTDFLTIITGQRG